MFFELLGWLQLLLKILDLLVLTWCVSLSSEITEISATTSGYFVYFWKNKTNTLRIYKPDSISLESPHINLVPLRLFHVKQST